MRIVISCALLIILSLGLVFALEQAPLGSNHIDKKDKPGRYYLDQGMEKTGAANVVTSVVVTYRGFDTLGEVTILFIAAIGLGAVLYSRKKEKRDQKEKPSASLILQTGCRFLFPLIVLFGTYVFIHGHLSPGGGFQGGVIIASAFLLLFLGCKEKKIPMKSMNAVESLAGIIFVGIGLAGLYWGGSFLENFLPRGMPHMLLSGGVIPIIYIAIGFKVGAELAGIVAGLIERNP